MAQPPLPRDLAQQAVDALAKHGAQTTAAAALGISRGTLQGRLRAAELQGVSVGSSDLNSEEKLRDRVFELESQLRAIRSTTINEEYVRRKILSLREGIETQRIPTWTVAAERDRGLPGVPCALWSDWHAGEVVDPNQINGKNSYDWEIMERRVRHLVETTINLLRNHVVNPQYPGVIINLGGDMVSGDIHEELSETNDRPMMPVVLDLFAILKWAITTMADEFGQVFLPCVAGNHGRTTKKPRAKGRAFTNFDWLLYQFLAKAFESDERVTFFIPDGPDALYEVYGHRYLLTHGDQFRGGDGQIGAIGPITRGNKRKLARNSAIDLAYDTMLLGHWHQYMPLHRSLVNGSLKGYDEYANSMNFEYEPPVQALWLTHPEYGIRMHMPVYLEGNAGKRTASTDWVSWSAR